MKKQLLCLLVIGILLLLSGCINSFMPAVRPEVETVGVDVVINSDSQALIDSVYDGATVQTGTLAATSRDSEVVEQTIVYNDNQGSVAFKLSENVWDMTVTASSQEHGVLYTGKIENIQVVVGESKTHTVELELATGDLELYVDLSGLDQGYQSPKLTLISPYASIPNQTQPISVLSSDFGRAEFVDVPVGPWMASLAADSNEYGTLEIMSLNTISPQGAGSIKVDVSVPLYSDNGFLDLTISNWASPPPKRPVDVSVEQRSNSKVRIEWEEPENQVAETMRYAVYRKIATADDLSYFKELRSDGIANLNYYDEDFGDDNFIDLGSRHGLTYTYWVQAYYTNGDGSFTSRLSEPVEITLVYMDEEIPDDPDGPVNPDPVDPGDDVDPVDGETVYVDSVSALNAAHANDEAGKIIFEDDIDSSINIDRSLVIDFGEHILDGNITIEDNVGTVKLSGNKQTPPDYHVTGTLTFGEGNTVKNYARIQGASPGIIITGESQLDESANENTIKIEASNAIVRIQNGVTVDSIIIDNGVENVQIENNGIVRNLQDMGTGTVLVGNEPQKTQ